MDQKINMRRVGHRLVWTNDSTASPEFWDEWFAGGDQLTSKLDRLQNSTSVGQYETPLLEYLPSTGKVLEAGCGYGKALLPLINLGYEAEGIEYSEGLVNAMLAYDPTLPVRWGDATAIERPDNYYAGYISLGVMEHRFEGPEPFLNECLRVLKPGGIAFISVPFYDVIWRLRSRWLPQGLPDENSAETFFQWHFTRNEFVGFIKEAGFEIVDVGSSGVRYGALRSVPFWGRMQKMRGGYRLWKALEFAEDRAKWTGWMQWVVARKPL